MADADQRAEWEAAVRRFLPAIRAFLRPMVPADRLDDLTQEVFTRLHKQLVGGKVIEDLRLFAYGIARNVVREFIRGRSKNENLELDDASALQFDPRPSSMLAREQDRILLLEALRGLSLDHQMVLQLYFWESMTSPEIAHVLGINENTVRSRLTRARAALLERLVTLQDDPTLRSPSPPNDADLDPWCTDQRPEDEDP